MSGEAGGPYRTSNCIEVGEDVRPKLLPRACGFMQQHRAVLPRF